MKTRIVKHLSAVNILFILATLVAPLFLFQKAEAAGLQQTFVRFDRMLANTPTTGMVCAKTAVADVTETNVVVTFPTGFTLGVFGTFTVNTTNLPVGATAWPGILTATNVTTQVVTFPSSDLTANTEYCFNWASTTAVTTTATPGTNLTGTVSSGGNTSTFSTAIVSSGVGDQITVTANVPATFTFSLSANTDTFASALSTTAQLSNGVTANVSTNAASGWITWVKSTNASLISGSTGATIPTFGTLNNAAESLTAANYGYLLDVTFTDSGTGTGTVTQGNDYGKEYDGNSSNTGGTLSTSFQAIAASSGTTDGDTMVLKSLARISSIQSAAADYTDTLTVVAAGRF